MEKIRIQKIIADSGYCSRRKAEQLMIDGRVKLNGRPVKLGDKALPAKDLISIDGQNISTQSNLRYIILYKPRGYVTTMSDDRGRKTVNDLMKGVSERVYPIGRLDKISEGLLLLTNDGAFANEIMHPSSQISKTYRVTIKGKISEEDIAQLMAGVLIDDKKTLPCIIHVLAEESERTVLQFIIKEGRNRQIRKMCETVGAEIIRLKRTHIGNLKLGMLKPGEYRDLTTEELRGLRRLLKTKND
ncbi:MAG: rRNA pseudouridine synthase [Clostridiales bacterium]|nr:rRNA pseudouridine synthase [Clostridiales bacterium]